MLDLVFSLLLAVLCLSLSCCLESLEYSVWALILEEQVSLRLLVGPPPGSNFLSRYQQDFA